MTGSCEATVLLCQSFVLLHRSNRHNQNIMITFRDCQFQLGAINRFVRLNCYSGHAVLRVFTLV
jgi:hypothetical protein